MFDKRFKGYRTIVMFPLIKIVLGKVSACMGILMQGSHATVQIKGNAHSSPQFLCFKRESVTVPTGKQRHHQIRGHLRRA